jgi:hypothetical protein
MTRPISFIARPWGDRIYACRLRDIPEAIRYLGASIEHDGDAEGQVWVLGPEQMTRDTGTRVRHAIFVTLPNQYDGAVMAHECVHAALFLFDMHGAAVDPLNSELFAYQVSDLFEQIASGLYGRKN